MTEFAFQVIAKILDILLSCLFSVLFFKHFADLKYFSNVMTFIFLFRVVDPFMNLFVFFTGSFQAYLDVLFNVWYWG